MHVHGGEDRVLKIGAAITLAYVLLTFVAGLRAHSLALISEAGHNLTDFLALLISWLGLYLQSKPANESKTFGYHRAGVLAALVNVLTLLAITIFVVAEAIRRLRQPVAVQPRLMLIVAAIGVVMNAWIALRLEAGRADVNVRGAFLHMVGDAVSTGLVIIGAGLIAFTGWLFVDPLLSLIIAGFILWSSWDVLRETLDILLEASPRGISPDSVLRDLSAVEGVCGVHDLHVWSLGARAHALSCHIRIADIPPSESQHILKGVQQLLAERYHIHHTTVQFEYGACEIVNGCVISAQSERG